MDSGIPHGQQTTHALAWSVWPQRTHAGSRPHGSTVRRRNSPTAALTSLPRPFRRISLTASRGFCPRVGAVLTPSGGVTL